MPTLTSSASPCTVFDLPPPLMGDRSGAEWALLNVLALDNTLVGAHRSEALLHSSSGATDQAAKDLEFYLTARPDDISAIQMLGNLYSRLGRPVDTFRIYKTLWPAFEAESTGVQAAHFTRRMETETIRAAHQALDNGAPEAAANYLSMVPVRQPADLVVLYNQLRLAQVQGQPTTALREALHTYRFLLPADPLLGALLPTLSADLERQGVWDRNLAREVDAYAAWQQSWPTLEPAPVCAYTPPYLWPAQAQQVNGNLLDNPSLQVEKGSANPWQWQWSISSDTADQVGLWYGGVAYQPDLGRNALYIRSIGNDRPGTELAGFSPPWIPVQPGHTYRLSFLYRTNDNAPNTVNIYGQWHTPGESPQQISTDLAGTQGQWQYYERLLTNPLQEDGEVFLLLRKQGIGRGWFADIRLEQVNR